MGKAKDQAETWQGEFGQHYTDRNLYSIGELDVLYKKLFGISRSEMNQRFIGHLDRRMSILEVGCNVGNQLLILQKGGFRDITGIDLQNYALSIAHGRLGRVGLAQGSALDLPFADESFDLIYTAGLLIHLPPSVLAIALDEIHRCTRQLIWGFEYFAEVCTPIIYRGQSDLLWKADYSKLYLSQFSDLTLVDEMAMEYSDADQEDKMFILEKAI